MWFFYSLFFALWTGLTTLITKRLTSNLSSVHILFISGIFTIPFTVILIFFLGGFPSLTLNFFKLMFFSSILDLGAFLMAIEGIRRSDVSLVAPMAAFSPVFTTFIAMFTLNEIPPLYKLLAIFVIVIGAYILQASEAKKGIFEPVKKLLSDQGVKLYFAAYLLWAITPIIQKRAIFETSPNLPLMASLMGSLFVFAFISPFALIKGRKVMVAIGKEYKLFLTIGIFNALTQLAAFNAFSLTKVGYVTSVFRLSGLFSVIGGALFFREKNIKEKLIGAAIMLLGTILLVV